MACHARAGAVQLKIIPRQSVYSVEEMGADVYLRWLKMRVGQESREKRTPVASTAKSMRLRCRLKITGFDAEAQRCRGAERQRDNVTGLFSAFFSAPQRLCVKIANFPADSRTN